MKIIIPALFMMLSFGSAFADETASEKVGSTAKDAKRSVKKHVNKAKEAMCAEGDAKCLAKKAKHRVEEGAETVKDKTNDTVDKVD